MEVRRYSSYLHATSHTGECLMSPTYSAPWKVDWMLSLLPIMVVVILKAVVMRGAQVGAKRRRESHGQIGHIGGKRT